MCNIFVTLVLFAKDRRLVNMRKRVLKVTKESKTGRNLEFKNVVNNEKLTATQLIKKLEKGNSVYNQGYYIKHQDGRKYIVSKPDGKENNNLG